MKIANDWLADWCERGHRGISSNSIAGFMVGGSTMARMMSGGIDAPHDPSDVGRCVELLDLAEANGRHWRERMPDMISVFPRTWGPLAGYWPRIEAAWHRDKQAQTEARQAHHIATWIGVRGQQLRRPRSGVPKLDLPPAESWWLLSMLRRESPPLRDYPDATGGGLWRPLSDTNPEPMERDL